MNDLISREHAIQTLQAQADEFPEFHEAIYLLENEPSVTPIPDNATNGEVMKILFPNIETELSDVLLSARLGVYCKQAYTWWNASYKAEREEDEITFNNLCNSCSNIGCEFQSGIVRTKCAFYMPPHIEPDNCGNYIVMQPIIIKADTESEDKE